MEIQPNLPGQVWQERKMPKLDGQKVVDSFISAATIWAPSGFEKPMAEKMLQDFAQMNLPGAQSQMDEA